LIEISGGKDHSFFVSDKGRVYTAGHNNYGQMGISGEHHDKEPKLIESLSDYKIVSAKAGNGYSLFLTVEGEVLACGNNQSL
jgi:alpha-tubulin suppressor-like RCC1 family protein